MYKRLPHLLPLLINLKYGEHKEEDVDYKEFYIQMVPKEVIHMAKYLFLLIIKYMLLWVEKEPMEPEMLMLREDGMEVEKVRGKEKMMKPQEEVVDVHPFKQRLKVMDN
jgi:hypothetical protein